MGTLKEIDIIVYLAQIKSILILVLNILSFLVVLNYI